MHLGHSIEAPADDRTSAILENLRCGNSGDPGDLPTYSLLGSLRRPPPGFVTIGSSDAPDGSAISAGMSSLHSTEVTYAVAVRQRTRIAANEPCHSPRQLRPWHGERLNLRNSRYINRSRTIDSQ